MKNAQKTMMLAASHLTHMRWFLLAVFALLFAADLIFVGAAYIFCSREATVSFQSVLYLQVIPVFFYVAYGVLLVGMLAYFLRFSAESKGLYALRSLPMGAAGIFWSILASMLAAMLLLWAVQLLAIYAGYGLYRLETLMFSNGASSPPANDLYLSFVRMPFLQLFYPRHPVFWVLAAFMTVLPAVLGAYLTASLCGRRLASLLIACLALACLIYSLILAQNAMWGCESDVLALLVALSVLLLLTMGFMLYMAWRRLSRSRLG